MSSNKQDDNVIVFVALFFVCCCSCLPPSTLSSSLPTPTCPDGASLSPEYETSRDRENTVEVLASPPIECMMLQCVVSFSSLRTHVHADAGARTSSATYHRTGCCGSQQCTQANPFGQYKPLVLLPIRFFSAGHGERGHLVGTVIAPTGAVQQDERRPSRDAPHMLGLIE